MSPPKITLLGNSIIVGGQKEEEDYVAKAKLMQDLLDMNGQIKRGKSNTRTWIPDTRLIPNCQ